MNKNEKNTLLKAFKKAHPKLVKLKPKITISVSLEFLSSEFPGEIKHSPHLVNISVRHPFIFDNRLVPKEFRGIEVTNIGYDDLPKEFPSSEFSSPMENYHSIENYVKFVDNNLYLIREKLKNPKLKRLDALEAITGGVDKLIHENIKLRRERIQDEKENIAFFQELLYEINQAYYLSDLYQKYCRKNLYYALTSTRLSKNRPLIIGLCWQVETRKKSYMPQTDYPFGNFNCYQEELGSLNQKKKYFHKYFPRALSGTYTNMCFFRAEKEVHVSNNDLELCYPIFKKLLAYIKPSCIISFTDKLPEMITNKALMYPLEIPNGKSTIKVSKGLGMINDEKIGIFNLPHPNLPIKKKTRKKAWEYCFGPLNF